MSRPLRTGFIIGGVLFLFLTVGFAFQLPFVTALWPWPDTPLSFLFLASISASIGGPMIWISWINEPGVVVGGALNLGLITGGTAVYMYTLYSQRGEISLLVITITSGLSFLLVLAMGWWSSRHPIQDQRPTPNTV